MFQHRGTKRSDLSRAAAVTSRLVRRAPLGAFHTIAVHVAARSLRRRLESIAKSVGIAVRTHQLLSPWCKMRRRRRCRSIASSWAAHRLVPTRREQGRFDRAASAASSVSRPTRSERPSVPHSCRRRRRRPRLRPGSLHAAKRHRAGRIRPRARRRSPARAALPGQSWAIIASIASAPIVRAGSRYTPSDLQQRMPHHEQRNIASTLAQRWQAQRATFNR